MFAKGRETSWLLTVEAIKEQLKDFFLGLTASCYRAKIKSVKCY
mgnify:CR=1 FL=1